jgi:hypothetical protein
MAALSFFPGQFQSWISRAGVFQYATAVNLTGRSSVSFSMRGKDGILLLSDDSETNEPWEITIGGWLELGGMSSIRCGCAAHATAANGRPT